MAPDTVGVVLHGGGDAGLSADVERWSRRLLGELRGEGAVHSAPTELSVVLCDDAFIRPLNCSWRGRDSATDVLSFPLEEADNLGDVVISVETAARRTRPGEWSLGDEVLFLLIHGLLHLLGYDHEEDGQRRRMEQAEQGLWTALGRVGTLRD